MNTFQYWHPHQKNVQIKTMLSLRKIESINPNEWYIFTYRCDVDWCNSPTPRTQCSLILTFLGLSGKMCITELCIFYSKKCTFSPMQRFTKAFKYFQNCTFTFLGILVGRMRICVMCTFWVVKWVYLWRNVYIFWLKS